MPTPFVDRIIGLWAFVGGSAPWSAPGYVNIDNCAACNYAATGNSPTMVERTVGSGSQYLVVTRDASRAFLDGGKNYRLHLPSKLLFKALGQTLDATIASPFKSNFQ